ncbi:MAG: diguanylate cyclase [Nitrospirae bacterium]|nr:MAG: diguanylate cyclase [Nitrospirota bacterium]
MGRPRRRIRGGAPGTIGGSPERGTRQRMNDSSKTPGTRILIVDDSDMDRLILRTFLERAGYREVQAVGSAREALHHLGMPQPDTERAQPDVILMDQSLGDMDGIEACRRIKAVTLLAGIPIVMVTANTDGQVLKEAFEAGVADYVTKPVREVEFLARIRLIESVKREQDMRKAHERELQDLARRLEASNLMLLRVASLDSLTAIPNRRRFEDALEQEWRRAMRDETPTSVILVDLDDFAAYNDTYGATAGDHCLKRVAGLLNRQVRRSGDLVARWEGDAFAVLLPATHAEGAQYVAETFRAEVEAMESPVSQPGGPARVTASFGVATAVPKRGTEPEPLIRAAQQALTQAQGEGANRVKAGMSALNSH